MSFKNCNLLGPSIEDFMPTDQQVRAYDNSRREVLGAVTLELNIGPMIKKVEFQVLNIASCFNILLRQPWIHDTEAVPSSLYHKVRFPHERAIVTIYGDTLTAPKPIFGIDSEKEPLTLDGFEIERPGFKRREEEVEKILMDFAPYNNNNVVAMMRRMNYLPRVNLGKTVKKPTIQFPMIPTATPPFGLGYKPTNDDLLEIEVRRMAYAFDVRPRLERCSEKSPSSSWALVGPLAVVTAPMRVGPLLVMMVLFAWGFRCSFYQRRKVGLPLALWQESGPNFMGLPKVIGVATNNWIFLRCD